MDKRVLLASPRGFCAGVDRAVRVVEQVLARHGPPVYVRHEIVHNTSVIERLTRAGVVFTDDLADIPLGAPVIFSAHGISPTVRENAAHRGLQVIDATCPLVSKVHAEARRFARAGYQIALIGHPDHVEIEGTVGHAPDRIHVINPDYPEPDIDALPTDTNLIWLSQTTLAVADVAGVVAALRTRFPNLQDPPGEDICYASTNRQEAVQAIASDCDLVLVIGSANSSNSRRLVEVALNAGALHAHLLDRADDLRTNWLEGVDTIGVTAGASAPEILVTDLLAALAEHGYRNVEHVTTAIETIHFDLPAAAKPEDPRAQPGGLQSEQADCSADTASKGTTR